MSPKILVLGGYGTFGSRISRALIAKGLEVLIAGRNLAKAEALAAALGPGASALQVQVPGGVAALLEAHQPKVLINTVGPFQGQDYAVAQAAIDAGVPYIDLADGRAFVRGFTALDADAKAAGVPAITGASTVPALSDAVLAEYAGEFTALESLTYGIAPGQGADRGLATTQGILSYVGKPLDAFPSPNDPMYGWQSLYRQAYPGLGKRWMATCEIPDLDLLPTRYGLKSIQFSAGLEVGLMHLSLWGLSWLVRWGLPLNLPKLARPMLWAASWFDRWGSPHGGMHMILRGTDAEGQGRERRWFIVARDGHGPHIPTVPAIILASRIARGEEMPAGAYPCLGLISLTDYLKELGDLNIEVFTPEATSRAA